MYNYSMPELDKYPVEWILVIAIIVMATYTYIMMPYNYFKNRGIPGPKPVPVLGNMYQMGNVPYWDKDIEWIQQYGKVVGTFFFGSRSLIVADTEMLKEIMIKEFDNFCDRRHLTGQGLFKKNLWQQRGAQYWRQQRQMLSPYFSTGTMKMIVPDINDILDSAVKWLELKINQGLNVNIECLSQMITMDVMCKTAFGVEVNTFENINSELTQKCSELMKTFGPGNKLMALALMFPAFGKLLDMFSVCVYDLSYLESYARQIIKEHKAFSKNPRNEFIYLLLQERGDSAKGMSDDEIIANTLLFLLAGTDTTAWSIAFLLYNLTIHPEWQDKVVQEIQDTIGDQEVTYESLQELHCLEKCLEESLRLYPLAPRVDRHCVKDTSVQGVLIEKDTNVVIPIWYLHRQPEIWENPEMFDPERFSPEKKKDRNPMHYLPFGAGPRHCIGTRMALLEAKIATVRVLQKFRFHRNEQTEVPLTLDPGSFITMAKNDIWVTLEERT